MTFYLQAETRKVFGKKNKALRRKGYLPAIIYGHRFNNIPLQLKKADFAKVLKEAGETTIIKLSIDGKKNEDVVIHDLVRDPVSDQILHIDFYKVKAGEKMTAEIPLVFEGEAPAVKDLGGVLISGLQSLKIKALPKDLPKEIKVDVSVLKDFETKIQVKDLKMPPGVEVLAGPDEIIASVSEPRLQKELEESETEEKETETEQIESILEEKEADKKEKTADQSAEEEKAEKEK